MSKKDKKLFAVSVTRVPGGYKARAEIATLWDGAYLVLNSTITKEQVVAGTDAPSHKGAAVQSVIEKAGAIIELPEAAALIPSAAKYAILSTNAVNELAKQARQGDPDAKVGMRRMKYGDNMTYRKAVRMQRLMKE
jgi:hypothetical protein